jgi:Bacterial Ig domain
MYSLVIRFALYSAVLICLSVLIGLTGCRKQQCDDSPPSIEILSPAIGSTFYYDNIISIRARITDNQRLKSIELEITDAQNNRFLTSETYTPTGNSYDIATDIQHNDRYLSSGTYFVRITASDGENEQIAFREIQLVEAPRRLERLFVIRTSGTTAAIDTLSNSALQPCLSFNNDYLFGGIDSRTQQLIASGSDPESFMSLAFPFFNPLPASFPATTDVLTSFHHDKVNHRFLWGTQSGTIWKTDATGTQLFSSEANGSVQVIGVCPSHLITITQSAGNNAYYVNAHRSDNGVLEIALPISWEVKAIIHLEAESQRVLLVGNQSGAAHFAWLNLATSAINEVFNFYETSPVSYACEAEQNDFVVIHEAGIARYNNLLDSYTLGNTVNATKVVFDDLENALWAVTPQTLYKMDANGQNILQTIAAPGLLDVWIKYNK